MRYLSYFDDRRKTIDGPLSRLDVLKPPLGLADQPGEHVLGEAAPTPVISNALADSSFLE
jgi:hypothetical protein